MFSLSTIEEISTLSETEEIECKLASGRDGKGEIPKDVWPTYSAFANVNGGVIFLGIREKIDGFELVGVKNIERMRTDLFNTLSNPQKVSVNLLNSDDVEVVEIDGYSLLAIRVPRASRKERPVYINGNPMTGTYRRVDTGDRQCDAETVRRMLAEQTEDSRDRRILRNFSISDLCLESVRTFRQIMHDRQPTHPFLEGDDSHFLRRLGAFRRDRDTGEEGLTAAGLLMFGWDYNIQDEFPNYHLDYQERPRSVTEARWVDRVTLDGSWSGNIFDFYRRVYRKLTSDLKVPFELKDGQRKDETTVHEALREALVNAIVHADYSGRASVLIVKRPDMFGFRNPGKMRLPVSLAIAGGESDGRNRTLQSMFLLIGAGERAGSGVPKIHKGWKDQHWAPPALYDLDDPSEQTRLELRMSDLIPTDAIDRLRSRFPQFDNLAPERRLILATADMEGCVSHHRLLSICPLHPVDLSRVLQALVSEGFLEQTGRTRGAVYSLHGTVLPTPDTAFEVLPHFSQEGKLVNQTPELNEQTPDLSEQTPDLSEEAPDLSEQAPDLSEKPMPVASFGRQVDDLQYLVIDKLEGLDANFLSELQVIANSMKERRRVSPEVSRAVIQELCRKRFVTIRVLSILLNRDEEYLRKQLLNPLVSERKLFRAFPQSPNDPRQAYTSC